MKLLPWLALFLLTTLTALSQVCSQGHGDPIVNITFGAGTGIGPELAPGITNMTYVAQECVGDNVYTITNEVKNCYVSDWHTVTKDHTGDPNGYFMLIGASFQPSTFYTQTVTGLCGSTQYQFSVWVLNMASHGGEGLPNFTFSIETTTGTPIQSFSTGDVPWHNPQQWDQYTFEFSTPAGVNAITLKMTNNAPGGYGNDLCLDDLVFRTLGPAASISVDGHTSDTVTICKNSVLGFSSVVANSCYTSTDYQWQFSTDKGVTWALLAGASNGSYSSPFPLAGTYLYRLTAAATGNITNSACRVVSAADTIVVLDPVDADVAINGPGGICSGAPATFTATPVNGGTSPDYQWMVNGLPATQTAATFTSSTFSDGDNISCQMTSNQACVNNPVVVSNTLPIAVSPPSVPGVSIATAATNICAGTPATFTATPTNGGASPGYQWMVNGLPATQTTATFTSSTLSDGDQISCTLTSNAACISNPTASSNTITMDVLPNLATAVDIAANGPTCAMSPVTFTATPTNGGTMPTYQWLRNGLPTAITNSVYIINSPQGGDRISCMMTSNISCPIDPQATSNIITISDLVSPSVTITPNANPICSNTPVTFLASPVNGGNNPQYQWLINGMPGSATGQAFNYNGSIDGDQITCILTSNAACTTNPVATSNNVQMSVIPIVYPSLVISTPDNPICSGSPVTFTAQPSTTDYDPVYRWMLNGVQVDNNGPSYTPASLKDGDQINAVMTNSQQCSVPAASNSISMTVNPIPSVSLPSDTVIWAYSTIQLLPQVNDPTLSFQWNDNVDAASRNLSDPFITPLKKTTYEVTVTTKDGCTSSAKETVEVFYDLIMPNAFTPNGDGINDFFRVPPDRPIILKTFVVFDRWGAVVFKGSGSNPQWDGRLNGKAVPSGTYIWLIEYTNLVLKQTARRQGTVELIR